MERHDWRFNDQVENGKIDRVEDSTTMQLENGGWRQGQQCKGGASTMRWPWRRHKTWLHALFSIIARFKLIATCALESSPSSRFDCTKEPYYYLIVRKIQHCCCNPCDMKLLDVVMNWTSCFGIVDPNLSCKVWINVCFCKSFIMVRSLLEYNTSAQTNPQKSNAQYLCGIVVVLINLITIYTYIFWIIFYCSFYRSSIQHLHSFLCITRSVIIFTQFANLYLFYFILFHFKKYNFNEVQYISIWISN